MNSAEKIQEISEDPIIPGLKSYGDIELAAQNDAKAVFVLFGSVANICDIVKRLKACGKSVYVNVDMVEGFAPRNAVVDFLSENTEVDGIISSKTEILRYAKKNGLLSIHRFYILDSSSWRSIAKQLELSNSDIINITPGWTKVIEWTVAAYKKPVISSGLVCDKEIVIENLNAGAIAICSTNHNVWNL